MVRTRAATRAEAGRRAHAAVQAVIDSRDVFEQILIEVLSDGLRPFFWCGLVCKAWRKDVRRAANLERVRASTGLSNPRHMTALADGRLCLLQADGRIKIFPADGRFSQPPKVVTIPGTDGVHATGLVHKTVGGTEHFYVTFDSHLVGRFLMHRFLPRAGQKEKPSTTLYPLTSTLLEKTAPPARL